MKGSKYTDEDREKALALISGGMSATKAAEKLGFPKSTVCHWWNTQMQDDEDVVAKRMEARRGTVEKCGKIVDRALGAIGKKVTAAASECREVNDGLKVLQKAAKDGVIGLSEEDVKKLRGIVADYTGVGLRELSGSMKDVHALQYQGSRQLILRRTYKELERSMVPQTLGLYPAGVATYNASRHVWRVGRSTIEMGYIATEGDVQQYQSAEYDVIRFDEMTHFTETQYKYMISRVRGVNRFPKHVKCSANPGSVGHANAKERFIDIGPPMQIHQCEGGSRLFIPAKLEDNPFLMEADPEYEMRLRNLPHEVYMALREGNWDYYVGQYFTEFKRETHVCEPFEIPDYWRRYVAIDYGLDMLAAYWVAVDETDAAVVYREVYEPNLIIPDAARRILEANGDEHITAWFAPKDLWNRRQETGRSVADIFAEEGLYLDQVSNGRIAGWYELKRRLQAAPNEFGEARPRLRIFNTCVNLIRTLPALQHDEKHPNDCATEPHEITHAPDAIRYFCDGCPLPAMAPGMRRSEYTYEEEFADVMGY